MQTKNMKFGQHAAELPEFHVLRLHSEVEIENDRIRRDLLAFDMEMMLGESGAVITVFIHIADLFADLAQHLFVQIRAFARHALEDVFFASNGREIKCTDFHNESLEMRECTEADGRASAPLTAAALPL